MSYDELERFRKFMIEQQAEFWAALQAMKGQQTEFRADLSRTERLAEENRQRIGQWVDVCLSLPNCLEVRMKDYGETSR